MEGETAPSPAPTTSVAVATATSPHPTCSSSPQLITEQLCLHRSTLSRIVEQSAREQERLFVQQSQSYWNGLVSGGRLSGAALSALHGRPPVRTPPVYADNARRRGEAPLGVQPAGSLDLLTIRLDIDTDGYKLRDTFVWNAGPEAGDVLTMERFAAMTCRDFDLPPAIFIPLIVRSMTTQVEEHREALAVLRNAGGVAALRGIRGLIRLDVTVGFLQLTDNLEWDLGEERNDPATFAEGYCRELALGGEFVTAVANDIREQVEHLRRALALVGYTRDPVTGAVRAHDPEVQALILPPLREGHSRRDPNALNEYSPVLTEYEPLELERIEQSRDRETRRKRRQTRGRAAREVVGATGVSIGSWTALEAVKTMRTPLSYRGSLHRVISRLAEDGGDESGAGGGAGATASDLATSGGMGRASSGRARSRRGRRQRS